MSQLPQRIRLVALSLFVFLHIAMSQDPPAPTPTPGLGALTYIGCYSNSDPLTDNGTYTFQSQGFCQQQCGGLNMPVMGLVNGDDCWCGSEIPAGASAVDNSTCDTSCAGYPQQNCGGNQVWGVFLTGTTRNQIPSVDGSIPGSDSKQPVSNTQSIITLPTQTVTATAPPESTTSAAPVPKSSGTGSTVGIAVGIVIGVIAIIAIIGGVWFFLRRRRQRQAEMGFQRGFMKEGRPPGTSSGDSRLDPSINNRFSNGSIADNADFSRRILKVTNPDG